jgi:hypothetical protein
MIRPKKASRVQYHISIVRANKRQVNVPFGVRDITMQEVDVYTQKRIIK